MVWRSGDRLLARRDDAFALIQPGGTAATWFTPRSFSDEDDLWVTTFVVVGDELVERTVIERYGVERLHGERVVVMGLRSVDDAESHRLAATAFHAADAHDQVLAREADARVTAIPGSLDELGLGADAARAQRLLCKRIRDWNDPRAATLLRTLLDLARARPAPAVIAAYARGCLCACFEVEVPELRAAPATQPPPSSALAREIEAHAAELECAADGQEAVDAMRNAAALWSAAKALRVAATLLG